MNKENPLVSIIVRTKDRLKLLRNALSSIAAQTYRPIEVVLVNDGGCDLDVEEIKEILRDISLNYIRLEQNTGRAHAGNVGIGNAKGEYIGFLDDDDELYPEHVATLVAFLEQSDYRVAYTDSLMVYKEYSTQALELIDTKKELVFSQDFDYDMLVFENYIPFMCLLFERNIIINLGGFDTNFDLYEDWDLLIRIGEKHPFYHLKETTANYNQWGSDFQISQRNKDYNFIEQSYLKVLSKHMDKITEKKICSYILHFVRTRDALKELNIKPEYLENAIKEKNERIKTCELTIENLERTIQDKENTIKDKDSHIGNLNDCLRDKELTLNKIYNSRGWKTVLIYYKIRDKLLPPKSRRRLFLNLLFIAIENPKGLLKNLDKNNIKKFFSQYKILEPSIIENKVRRKTTLYFMNKEAESNVTFNENEFLTDFDNLRLPEGKNHVLVVDRSVPTYDRDSGSLRMYSFLKILTELGYKITFLPDDLLYLEPYTSELQNMGIEVLYGNVDIEKYLVKNGNNFTFVIFSRPEQVFKYISLIRAYAINSSVIYDTVDLHWIRFERAASVTGRKEFLKNAEYYKSLELFNASCADIIFTVTNDEKESLLKELPDLTIEVIPNIHEVFKVDTPFEKKKDIMFVGGFIHQPNEDAVFYFIEEIFPMIKEKIKDMRFFVVGSDPSPAILSLNSKDIVVTGYVKDLIPYFESCRIFVSPLRYGAGMKGKIGQSMAYGMPVVTTTIGAEGIGLIDGENALIADEPKDFADAIIRLYTDENLWNKISAESIEYIGNNYSKEVVGRKIAELFHSIRFQEV